MDFHSLYLNLFSNLCEHDDRRRRSPSFWDSHSLIPVFSFLSSLTSPRIRTTPLQRSSHSFPSCFDTHFLIQFLPSNQLITKYLPSLQPSCTLDLFLIRRMLHEIQACSIQYRCISFHLGREDPVSTVVETFPW